MASVVHKDKENEVYRGKQAPRTPSGNKVTKKLFRTPPLKQPLRVPLGGNVERGVSRLLPVDEEKIRKLQENYLRSDSKLEEFLKIEESEELDVEITPQYLPPLQDEPDDGISFKEIDLHKIYASPFHVPKLETPPNSDLIKLLRIDLYDDDLHFLQTPPSTLARREIPTPFSTGSSLRLEKFEKKNLIDKLMDDEVGVDQLEVGDEEDLDFDADENRLEFKVDDDELRNVL